jgi:1,4-alpha-glucan branching enzyme
MLLNKQSVWEVVYTAKEYQKYQYLITTDSGEVMTKIDPYSYLLDGEYSVIYDYHKLKLNNPKIPMKNEGRDKPLNIYELFFSGWSNKYKTYREIAEPLAAYLNEYGYNAVQFMPLTEYKTDKSWGYQPVGFFAPTQRFGSPEDLIYLIDCLHKHNIYIFLDWTPAHFDNCSYGLKNYDGGKMYEFPYEQYEQHPIWQTYLFDWGNPYVSSFLISSANFWLGVYGFDGLRVDTVTTLVQLFELNERYEVTSVYYNHDGYRFCYNLTHFIKSAHPNAILIAEET